VNERGIRFEVNVFFYPLSYQTIHIYTDLTVLVARVNQHFPKAHQHIVLFETKMIEIKERYRIVEVNTKTKHLKASLWPRKYGNGE